MATDRDDRRCSHITHTRCLQSPGLQSLRLSVPAGWPHSILSSPASEEQGIRSSEGVTVILSLEISRATRQKSDRIMPPSTRDEAPLIAEALGEQRKATTFAISSGDAHR